MINLFNAQAYLRQNPDVAEAVEQGYLTAEQHFELYGQAEGRSPGPYFDVDYYLASNPDVAEIAGNNKGVAYAHFLNYGLNEGRSPVAFFDPEFYLAQNPDVAQAVHEGQGTAIQHFLIYGLNEPRQISVSLNLKDYLEANPDVAQAVSEGHAEALSHLLTYGITEGRDLGNGISLKDFANDPTFIDALAKGDTSAALDRVDKISPFMPDFKAPSNWELAVGTELPTDFVPVEGKTLVVPEGFKVSEDTPLPPAFEVQKPSTPEPEEPSGEDDNTTPDVPTDPEVTDPVEPEPTEPEEPGGEDDNTTPGVPTDPEVTDPVEPEKPEDEASSDFFSEWTLVLPGDKSLLLYHQGEINNVHYEQDSYHDLEFIKNNLDNDKVLYYQSMSSSSSSMANATYTGNFYLFDAQEGLKNLGTHDGAYSVSPNGDIAFFGNESRVVSADLNHYTHSSIAIPAVNSQIIWNEDYSQVWFSTHSVPYGTELFSYTINSDLSLEGGLVKDIFPGSSSGINSSYLENNFALLPNDKAIFYANSGGIDGGIDGGIEVWISDGTEENTVKLDFLNNYISSYYNNPIKNFQDKVVFSTEKYDYDLGYYSALVMTQGEEDETLFIELDAVSSRPEILWITEDTLFFSAKADKTKIFKTDINGDYEELMEVSSVSVLGHNEEKAFLAIHDDTHGQELWVMDTKKGESQLVKDILPGTGSSLGDYQESMMINGKLLFSAYTSATNQQLFISDGTELGTIALSEGPANYLLTVNNYIFYSENNSLYTVNTTLKEPIPTLVKDNIDPWPWGLALQHDENQIFFKGSYEDNAVYSYNWETKQLEKIMDSVDVFSVVEENVVFGLAAAPDYFYDEDTGNYYHYQTLEWFLSDGTAEGTESTKIKLDSNFYPGYNSLENATLLHSDIELVGSFSQDQSFDDFV